tara:strand:+ start:18024 stop:18287 length:264 start_codon:yes stop_codon:yes gene_type:complete
MKLKSSKPETEKRIEEIFSNSPNPKEIKKVKKLAMSKNIKISDLRKKFCKKCYSLFNSKNSKIKIKKGFKIIKCKKCEYISRYKLKK